MQQSWVKFGVGNQRDTETQVSLADEGSGPRGPHLSLSIYCFFFFFFSLVFLSSHPFSLCWLVLLGNTHGQHTLLHLSLIGCCYSSFNRQLLPSLDYWHPSLVPSPLRCHCSQTIDLDPPFQSLSLTTLHYRSHPYSLFIPLSVERGGLFSASASGYSKGLTLLLSGWKTKERPMKVSPWCQYQLVEQEADPVFCLASLKSRVARGCTAFVCFGSASAGSEASTPPKVGPIQQQDILTEPSVSHENDNIVSDHEDNKDERKVCLKSSWRKPSAAVPVVGRDNNVDLSSVEEEHEVLVTESKKVQWTDACGKELVEIKEFDPSDLSDSDEDYENEMTHTCGCVIT